MKQTVIEFFQNLPEAKHDQFNKAFELYRQSEGKNPISERVFNAKGFTPSTLENLLYDLQKMHGISDVEKVSQVGSQKLEERSEQEGNLPSTDEVVANINKAMIENETLEFENLEFKHQLEYLNLPSKVDAKQIRVEFPFLNEKDCPDELKILVADKITTWNAYLTLQELIAKVEAGEAEATPKRLAEYAQEAVILFDENQKIYDELNCYQTTGKVLGVHPIFKKLQLTREVETMTADELIKYKGSSAKYFSVKKTALAKAKKAKDEAKVLEITNSVAERHDKLFLVNKKLGV